MSAGDHVSDRHGDAAAYALGALEPAEVEAFRAHLTDCAECREEVAAFEQAVDVLPAGVPQYAVPKQLRGRVMREVRATPKAGAARATPKARAARATPKAGAGASRRAPLFAALRPRALVAGGALAVVVVAVIVAVVLGSGGTSTRVVEASVTGSSASAELVISGDHGALIAHGLSQLPAGRVYEMWVQRGTAQPVPTGTLFSATRSGTASVGVPQALSGVRDVLVTQEPAGGTVVPTTPPVIVARLS